MRLYAFCLCYFAARAHDKCMLAYCRLFQSCLVSADDDLKLSMDVSLHQEFFTRVYINRHQRIVTCLQIVDIAENCNSVFGVLYLAVCVDIIMQDDSSQ